MATLPSDNEEVRSFAEEQGYECTGLQCGGSHLEVQPVVGPADFTKAFYLWNARSLRQWPNSTARVQNGTDVTMAPATRHIGSAIVKAIAPAFRWREMLENGTYATIAEIAAAETINESYVGRVLRLTLLAPDIVEMIMSGQQPAELQTGQPHEAFSGRWPAQRSSRREAAEKS